MTPSSATRHRTSRVGCRRRCNTAAGGAGTTARALAAGLWRHQHGSSLATAKMLGANQRRTTQCPCSRNHPRDKYDPSSMEKATKWEHDIFFDPSSVATNWKLDRVYLLDDIVSRKEGKRSRPTMVALLESELDRALTRIGELEEEKRVTSRRLEKWFLRKLEEEKSRTKERLRLERKHRRELEAANARLLRELSGARLAAKQQARRYETERKARELMEEACAELTREVEEDQAEVELLRRECLRMREEMEEERRMLQMAEVWREERVQMKLSDAKMALEHKYSQLDRLQAEMEAFLSLRRRKDKQEEESLASPSSYNPDESVSPATDLFLAKADDDRPFSDDDGSADDGDQDSCNRTWTGTSDPSVSVPVVPASNASFFHNIGASKRSGRTKNAALIRGLWSTAITGSRKKTGSDRNRRSFVTAAAAGPLVAAEQCSSSGSVDHHQERGEQRRARHAALQVEPQGEAHEDQDSQRKASRKPDDT